MSKAAYEDLQLRRRRAIEEAAAWLVRLQEDGEDAAVRRAYTDWLRESPLHVASMLRVSQTDGALAAFEGWNEIPAATGPFQDTVVEWPAAGGGDRNAPLSTKSASRGLLWSVLAASFVAGCAALLLWKQTLGGSVFETGTGESRVVTLADGSTLQLGPQSHARVVFSARQRDVSLGRGEAVFKVAKDPARPFTVLADRARVRAVGTEFGVERRGDAVVVTVAEGRVAVSASASPVTFPFMKDSPPLSPIALDADEQVAIPHVGRTGPVRRVDSASSLAWVHGRLVFNDDVISLVVERFNQYNHVRLVLRDPTIASRRISGSFDATDPESFLAFLHSSIPGTVVHRRHEGEIEIGTASGP